MHQDGWKAASANSSHHSGGLHSTGIFLVALANAFNASVVNITPDVITAAPFGPGRKTPFGFRKKFPSPLFRLIGVNSTPSCTSNPLGTKPGSKIPPFITATTSAP